MTGLYEMEQAVREARETLSNADRVALSLARLLQGRLRKVDSKYVLSQLKRELHDFNSVTGKWRDQ